tara:strand:- start:222 stop:3287 length:3066 start_codon:yes stop_codon:yes gene_type:complete
MMQIAKNLAQPAFLEFSKERPVLTRPVLTNAWRVSMCFFAAGCLWFPLCVLLPIAFALHTRAFDATTMKYDYSRQYHIESLMRYIIPEEELLIKWCLGLGLSIPLCWCTICGNAFVVRILVLVAKHYSKGKRILAARNLAWARARALFVPNVEGLIPGDIDNDAIATTMHGDDEAGDADDADVERGLRARVTQQTAGAAAAADAEAFELDYSNVDVAELERTLRVRRARRQRLPCKFQGCYRKVLGANPTRAQRLEHRMCSTVCRVQYVKWSTFFFICGGVMFCITPLLVLMPGYFVHDTSGEFGIRILLGGDTMRIIVVIIVAIAVPICWLIACVTTVTQHFVASKDKVVENDDAQADEAPTRQQGLAGAASDLCRFLVQLTAAKKDTGEERFNLCKFMIAQFNRVCPCTVFVLFTSFFVCALPALVYGIVYGTAFRDKTIQILITREQQHLWTLFVWVGGPTFYLLALTWRCLLERRKRPKAVTDFQTMAELSDARDNRISLDDVARVGEWPEWSIGHCCITSGFGHDGRRRYFRYIYSGQRTRRLGSVLVAIGCVLLPPAVLLPIYTYSPPDIFLDIGDGGIYSRVLMLSFAFGLPAFWFITCLWRVLYGALPNVVKRAAPTLIAWFVCFTVLPITVLLLPTILDGSAVEAFTYVDSNTKQYGFVTYRMMTIWFRVFGGVLIPLSSWITVVKEAAQFRVLEPTIAWISNLQIENRYQDAIFHQAMHAVALAYIIPIVLVVWAACLLGVWRVDADGVRITIAVFIVCASLFTLLQMVLYAVAQMGGLYWSLLPTHHLTLGQMESPPLERVSSSVLMVISGITSVWGFMLFMPWVFGDTINHDRYQNYVYTRWVLASSLVVTIIQAVQLLQLRGAIVRRRRYGYHPADFEVWPGVHDSAPLHAVPGYDPNDGYGGDRQMLSDSEDSQLSMFSSDSGSNLLRASLSASDEFTDDPELDEIEVAWRRGIRSAREKRRALEMGSDDEDDDEDGGRERVFLFGHYIGESWPETAPLANYMRVQV